jgi:cyclopropane fatty-acyl-phospholipid synthase-like methyltransferase
MLVQEHGWNKIFKNDDTFNKLYPIGIERKAIKHWSRLEIAKSAAEFLAAQNNVHVLDIGSGVGKFCLAAA